MDNMYVQVLIQWSFLFALVAVVAIPALLFRKIAMENNKRGWPYLLLGFGIGFLSLQAGRLIPFFVMKLDHPMEYEGYLAIPMLIISYTLVFIAVKIFRRKVTDMHL